MYSLDDVKKELEKSGDYTDLGTFIRMCFTPVYDINCNFLGYEKRSIEHEHL